MPPFSTATPSQTTRPSGAPSIGQQRTLTSAPAMLYPSGSSREEGVTFDFNPRTIKVSHGASLQELGPKQTATTDSQQKSAGTAEGGSSSGENLSTQQALDKLGMTSLKLGDLVFDGAGVLADCGKLLYWSYAQRVTGPAPQGKTMPLFLTPLTFYWQGFMLGANTTSEIPVILTRADVSYDRFTPAGQPIRATVSLDLQPTASNPLAQNPTSAGLAGRSEHILTSGETLQGVAAATYGLPSQWRTLAEANQIDDPLRVQPGAALYLPSRSELARRRP